MRKKDVVAIVCSDLHLSHKPPSWRSEESDWYVAMKRPLQELGALHAKYQVPILCAGDLFDRWNSPPELINFAMDHLPPMYCIPGQHDLPYHDMTQIDKSAYWTLVKAEHIINLEEGAQQYVWGMQVRGFPWGVQCVPPAKTDTIGLRIALVHEYVWIPGYSYPTALGSSKLSSSRTEFKKWDVVVIGDNHISWDKRIGRTTFFNCGGFYRRKSDEDNHKPRVGLVRADGTVESHYLDISCDKHLSPALPLTRKSLNMDGLVDGLASLGTDALDFTTYLKHYMKKNSTKKEVRTIIDRSLE